MLGSMVLRPADGGDVIDVYVELCVIGYRIFTAFGVAADLAQSENIRRVSRRRLPSTVTLFQRRDLTPIEAIVTGDERNSTSKPNGRPS